MFAGLLNKQVQKSPIRALEQLVYKETAVRSVFLKIAQNVQENTCVSFLIKL